MHPPRWYWRRLRAMSVPEVVHRARRLVMAPLERQAPLPSRFASWMGPEIPYRLAADRAAADRILRGERDVLGIGRITLPRRFDDPRLTWELERGHDWVTVAAVADQDPRFRSWLEQAVIGEPPGAAMEAAIRIHSLVAVAALTRPDPPTHCAAMIFQHAAFVERHLSAYSSANNHLVVELTGLVIAARVLDTPSRHMAALERAVGEQVFGDGVHAEMATHYHAFVLEALALVALVERAHGTSHAWLDRTIAAMAHYLAALACDRGLLQQGDDDGGRIVAGFQIPVAETPAGSELFPQAGQVVLRSPRLHVTFDAGPFGFGTLAAHAHCDALAISVACDRIPFLVDRGTYRYAGDDTLRDELRATAAHNTLQVADLEQAEVLGPFLWGRKPNVTLERCELADRDIVIASHDGFGPTTHRRTLLRHGDAMVVIDRADTALPITARYHFAPDAATSGWVRAIEGTATMRETRHSRSYGAIELAPTLEVIGQSQVIVALGVGDDSVVETLLAEARELGLLTE